MIRAAVGRRDTAERNRHSVRAALCLDQPIRLRYVLGFPGVKAARLQTRELGLYRCIAIRSTGSGARPFHEKTPPPVARHLNAPVDIDARVDTRARI